MASVVEIVLRGRDQSQEAVKSVSKGIQEIENRIEELKKIQSDAAKTLATPPNMSAYIDAQDDLKVVTRDLDLAQKELAESTKELESAQTSATSSSSGLFKTFTMANLAATAIQKGVQMVNQTFRDSINEAASYELALMGLNSAGAAFGFTADQMNTAIKEVTSDGLLGFSTAATTLKTLLQTGMDLDTATMLMERFKDEAAFGKKGTIDYATAVENLAQAFKTESSQLGDACLVYETPIMTSDGMVYIGELVENETCATVYSFDIITGKIQERKIINHFDNGVKRSMRVTLASGRVIEGTFDHKLYRPDGSKVEFQDLCPDDLVVSATTNPENVSLVQETSSQRDQTKNGVAPASTNPSTHPLKSTAESANTTLSPLDTDRSFQKSAQSAVEANPTVSTFPGKTIQIGKVDTNLVWTAQSVAESFTNTETNAKRSSIAAENVLTEVTQSGWPQEMLLTSKESMPHDTGENSSNSTGKEHGGEEQCLNETITPANTVDITEENTSTPITSSKPLSIQSRPSMLVTGLPSVSGATDLSMEVSETEPEKKSNDSSSNNLSTTPTPQNVPQDIGTLTKTLGENSQNYPEGSKDGQGLEISLNTLVDLQDTSQTTKQPLENSMSDLDMNTQPLGLDVQLDRVISVEEIGDRHTYNITVEGEHNYFLGDSLDNLTLTANSGHVDNFSNAIEIGAAALGKQVAALTEAEREQAKLIGYMQQGAHTAGDAARYAETYAGSLAKLDAESEKAAISMGQVLTPAVEYVTTSFTNFLTSLNNTSQGTQDLQAFLVTLSAIVMSVARTVTGAAQIIWGAFNSIATMSWDPFIAGVDAAGEGFVQTWQDAWTQYENIYNEGSDGMSDAQLKALEGMVAANGQAQDRMGRQVEDATRQFQRQMESRRKSFEESLRDMIISHRDKSRSIEADIAKEQAAYDAANLKRKQAYEDDLASLEERHLEKVQDIEGQISEEREKGLVVDGILYQTANEKKIAKLEENLRKEQASYQKSVENRKAKYNEDVENDQARHDDKMQQLQTSLQAELEILNKHRVDVAKVGDAVREDDITRLKRQFKEANAEAVRNHQEQLARIRQQGSAQGSTYGGAYTNSATAELEKLRAAHRKKMDELKNQAGKSGSDSAKSMWDNFKSGLSQWFRNLPQHITNLFKDIDKHTGAVSGATALLNLMPGGGTFSHALKALTGRSTGGTVRPGEITLVGERGPEIAQYPPGTRIYPTEQSRQILQEMNGQSRGTTVNIGTVVNQSNMDADAFLSGLSWYLR